jgi:hypothetical protein
MVKLFKDIHLSDEIRVYEIIRIVLIMGVMCVMLYGLQIQQTILDSKKECPTTHIHINGKSVGVQYHDDSRYLED